MNVSTPRESVLNFVACLHKSNLTGTILIQETELHLTYFVLFANSPS
jgi:hypothetical protein